MLKENMKQATGLYAQVSPTSNGGFAAALFHSTAGGTVCLGVGAEDTREMIEEWVRDTMVLQKYHRSLVAPDKRARAVFATERASARDRSVTPNFKSQFLPRQPGLNPSI